MSLKIQQFIRKPFPVEGVRVTKGNMELVAQWASGEVRQNAKGVRHIFIDVHRPMTERQTMAFEGDWVLFADRGYKIYTQNAFSRNFELVQAGIGSDHADFEPVPGTVDAEEDTPLEGVDFAGETQIKLRAPATVNPDQLRKLQEHFKPEDRDPHRF